MSASHHIVIDRARRLVDLTLTGFFSVADAGLVIYEIREAILGLAGLPNTHCTLVDVREAALQPQDVVAAFAGQIADDRFRSRRLAFVVGSSVARMQVRRLIIRDDVAGFEHRDEAERWLFSPEVSRAPA